MTKDLKEKSIKIKGKDYVEVAQRVVYFNDEYQNGYIQTQLLSNPSDEMVVIKAKVIPDMSKPERFFTGHSQAKWGDGYINKTSALENAETSAIGRALAAMGIGVIDSIASADEVHKAESDDRGKTNYAERITNTMTARYCITHKNRYWKPSLWGKQYPNCVNASGTEPCRTKDDIESSDELYDSVVTPD